MAEIRLDGVNKVYPGGTHAVHDVDLDIADGEFMIMVGPSGCAKSTILRMIAGLETPTTGTVAIGGQVVNDVAPKDRDIAMVFQSYALYPHMTVRDNMAFGLKLRRMPPQEIAQRVDEAARILGLERLLDRLPKAMSGGQRQRVAMGRAIVREPRAFLMDEPLSNLDAKLRVQMRTEIAKLHQRLGTTTVYVTHDQVEAMTLGQRICILRAGVVQQVDTPFQVYQNPANVFVGGFMGSPGMNFLDGLLVVGADGRQLLQLGNHVLPLPASIVHRMGDAAGSSARPVVVGVRPEHIAATSWEDPLGIPVDVDLTETMGSELYAYFTARPAGITSPDLTALSDTQATAETFVARLAANIELRAGAQVALRPDLEEVHLFDVQSQRTLLAPVDEATVRARQAASTPIVLQSAPVAVLPAAAPAAAPAESAVANAALVAAPERSIAAVFDEPAPVVEQQPVLAEAVGSGPRHGFASRPITAPASPAAPATVSSGPGTVRTTLEARPEELDSAIEAATEDAPAIDPIPDAPRFTPGGSAFRDALRRAREQSAQAPRK